MAASSPASLPPRKWSIGSRATNPIRGDHASKTSIRFFMCSIEPNILTAAHSTPESTFHPRRSSAPLDIERLAAGSRGHWGVKSMHWVLDVEFKDDLSRYRAGHGAKNMAVVRRFALGLLRANKSKGSIKT